MEEAIKLAMTRTWAEINLDNLEKNIQNLKGLLRNNAKFLGVCKANAYGHGMVQIAKKLQECKADMIAVASVQEGIELRKKGISIPILCFGQSSPELTNLICKYRITQTIENFQIGKAFSHKALELQKKVKIHIKVDTGMGRIGFFWPEEGGDLNQEQKNKTAQKILELCNLPGLEPEGIFTHFADGDNEEYTKSQINKFNEILEYMSNLGIKFQIAHAAASTGLVKYPEAHFDMGRFGLILYGYASTETGNKESDLNLIPIMTVKSRVSSVRNLPKGSTVSYGSTYKLKSHSTIAVLPIGYADGFPRCLSNKANVKIHNRLCPVLGRVCMDIMMVDVTSIKDEVKAGDIAIIFDEELITESAQKANTIIHEILSQILSRVNRVYIDKGKYTI
jgi:alanine racemase